jgi:hypothetical protein
MAAGTLSDAGVKKKNRLNGLENSSETEKTQQQ